jgi:hypothetical protein
MLPRLNKKFRLLMKNLTRRFHQLLAQNMEKTMSWLCFPSFKNKHRKKVEKQYKGFSG